MLASARGLLTIVTVMIKIMVLHPPPSSSTPLIHPHPPTPPPLSSRPPPQGGQPDKQCVDIRDGIFKASLSSMC